MHVNQLTYVLMEAFVETSSWNTNVIVLELASRELIVKNVSERYFHINDKCLF